jgi:hypothetical protein
MIEAIGTRRPGQTVPLQAYSTRDMVEAGGVETNSGTENAQLIDFSRPTKRQKLEKRGQLERIWNTASGCQNESLVDLPISASYRTGVLLPDSADQALAESGS